MHLVPLSHVSSAAAKEQYRRRTAKRKNDEDDEQADDLDEFISAQDAVKLLHDSLEKTQAPNAVERAVWNRISGYAVWLYP